MKGNNVLDIGAHTKRRGGRIETWTMTVEELKAVFGHAKRGDYIVYAVGDLAHERQTAVGPAWAQAEKTAKLAYTIYERGDAELTQKKLGPNKHEYRIHKI